jgi:hypothetical protein
VIVEEKLQFKYYYPFDFPTVCIKCSQRRLIPVSDSLIVSIDLSTLCNCLEQRIVATSSLNQDKYAYKTRIGLEGLEA